MTSKTTSKKVVVHKKSLTPGKSKDLVERAMEHLRSADPLLHAAALPHHEYIRTNLAHRRNYDALFQSLAGSIVSQQLSVKAADTIWSRLEVVCKGSVTPDAILRLRALTLRKAGLSAAKVKTLKELSLALQKGQLDLPALKKIPEEDAIRQLSSIWGIGRWTSEMFLMFALGREDVFSPGDLGLRRSMESIYGLPKDVPAPELEEIALRWSPHRTFASRVLWRVRDSTSE